MTRPQPLPASCAFRDIDAALRITGGSRALADELFDQFRAELPHHMVQLEALVAAMDMTGLRQQLHQLKGGAAVCAVTAFIEVLDELHDAARNKDQQLIPEYFLDLRRCADSLLG